MDAQQPHHISMTYDSRLRYFNMYQDLILETLNHSKDGEDMPDHIKVRLASAYLDLRSND